VSVLSSVARHVIQRKWFEPWGKS